MLILPDASTSRFIASASLPWPPPAASRLRRCPNPFPSRRAARLPVYPRRQETAPEPSARTLPRHARPQNQPYQATPARQETPAPPPSQPSLPSTRATSAPVTDASDDPNTMRTDPFHADGPPEFARPVAPDRAACVPPEWVIVSFGRRGPETQVDVVDARPRHRAWQCSGATGTPLVSGYGLAECEQPSRRDLGFLSVNGICVMLCCCRRRTW